MSQLWVCGSAFDPANPKKLMSRLRRLFALAGNIDDAFSRMHAKPVPPRQPGQGSGVPGLVAVPLP